MNESECEKMRLGVIGGMGPMATAYFMELVVNMTMAKSDNEHLEMIVYNCPTIPDRTAYITGRSLNSPLPKLTEIAEKLKEQSVTCIAIPCMTAHYFYNDLQSMGIPIIHGIRETITFLKRAGIKRVGIMATTGTISSEIFQKELKQNDMTAVVPDEVYQEKVMDMIYKDIKAGKIPDEAKVQELKYYFLEEKGAEIIVLGCTELSLLKKKYDLGVGVIDALEVLAWRAIELCGKEINEEYKKLFSSYIKE